MDYEKGMKEQFVKMLNDKQIICFGANRKKPGIYEYKIIGADSYGRWDFTATIAEETSYKAVNGTLLPLAIKANNVCMIIGDFLQKLHEEGLFDCEETGYGLYSYVWDRITIYYL